MIKADCEGRTEDFTSFEVKNVLPVRNIKKYFLNVYLYDIHIPIKCSVRFQIQCEQKLPHRLELLSDFRLWMWSIVALKGMSVMVHET